VIRSFCALLAQGKSDYAAIEQHREDDFFRKSLGLSQVPRVAIFSVTEQHSATDENSQDQEYSFRRVVRVTERTIDKKGQQLLIPETELEGWWTSLSVTDEEVIALYEGHGLCEQYHSEIKTDMDLERFPSGKFVTNQLVMACTALVYNIQHPPVHRSVQSGDQQGDHSSPGKTQEDQECDPGADLLRRATHSYRKAAETSIQLSCSRSLRGIPACLSATGLWIGQRRWPKSDRKMTQAGRVQG